MLEQSSYDIVLTAIAMHLGDERIALDENAQLERDLGLDALDLTLIVLRLDELAAVDVAIADLEGLLTVRDLTELVDAWICRRSERVATGLRRTAVRKFAS